MKNCELKKILLGVSWMLSDQKLINTPFQIAISEYNPKEKWGKYLFFCVDVSPLIEFTHIILSPLRYNDTINEYKSKLESLSKKYDVVNDERLRLRNYEKAIVRNSYKDLRDIKFEAPLVLSEFYSKCKEEHNSQQIINLHLNDVYMSTKERTLNWELGCFLEKKLFSTGTYTNFSSTFFVFNENAEDKNTNTIIYSISVFNGEDEGEKIRKGQREILELIDENDKIALLEEVLDKIPDSKSSESITIPPPADVNE